MEPERVEMSVGGGSANGGHAINGVAVNGLEGSSKKAASESQPTSNKVISLANGAPSDHDLNNGSQLLQDASPELLDMLSTEFYLPMAKLVNRSAQECWNDIVAMVEKLSRIPTFAQSSVQSPIQANDQSKANLDKKDELLNFANKHKAVFIKLLVLLAWSKRGEEVRKTIELNFWLAQRRLAFNNATITIGRMMQDLANSQVPNPDLYTAAEVLALGKISKLPDLGYRPQPPLSPKQILRTLRRLNNVLCTRLALDTELPQQMRTFRVHDGRVTFRVPEEFELDLSLLNEAPDSRFLMVDLHFSFSPAPLVPDSLHDHIAAITNSAIEKDGLLGAYNFIHDLTLSYKLAELTTQARELAQGLWAGHLKVEMLRRTLVVQYWLKRRGPKSWIEIGIHSGRKSPSANVVSSVVSPRLQLRWLRDGKAIEGHSIELDLLHISFEKVLRQVIAYHTNFIFDSVYDKFALTPMYADGELELEQASSTVDPAACSLDIQLSKTDRLNARIEPVSGAVTLSPVSDRTNRTQDELIRSRNMVDEFVGKVSNLRCAISESNLLRIIANSSWQHLPGLKLSHAETEAIFSQPVVRASFFRQLHWSSAWMLAVTHSSTGDHWWLTKRLDETGVFGARMTQMLQSRPLHLETSITPAYLERLAGYASGLIMLQTNAQYLGKKHIPYTLPVIPSFSDTSKLPALRFESNPSLRTRGGGGSCLQSETELTYHGSNLSSNQAIMIARARFNQNAANLKELASSRLDNAVSISYQSKAVMIRVNAETGSSVTDEIISKLKHVDNIVACAATVKRSTSHALRSLSLSAITVAYNLDQSQELGLAVHFATASEGLRAELLPPNQNPHQQMAVYITQMLTKAGQSLSRNLEDVLALLKMTQPLMTYLNQIQSPETGSIQQQTSNGDASSSPIRVHILSRQATSYALHYFSKSEDFHRDVTDSETPKKLLIRLEVFSTVHSQRPLWVVRPAIEEFNSYNRPSYTSNELKERIKAQIFTQESSDWLRLDTGAAVTAEKPERLLSKIHKCVVDWLVEALKAGSSASDSKQVNQINGMSNSDGSNEKKPVSTQQQRQPSGQKPSGRPNGLVMPSQGQRSNSNYGGNLKNAPIKKEVITLD